MVHLADLAEVALAGQSQFVVGKVLRPALGLHFRREGGKREGGGIVEVEVLLRRHPRRMGGVDAGNAEKGLAGLGLLAHEFDRLFGDEGGVGHVSAAAGGKRS